MKNFEFHNPTKIVFGADTIAQLSKLVPDSARVLILYGGASAEKTGTLAEVRRALDERVSREFGGIEPNPSYETLMRAVEQVRRDEIDFLLAVGGGSVIDGTKFVAAAALYDGEPWEIAQSGGAKVRRALPFGAVLTLPATGSEMNNGAVVTHKATHTKLPFRSPLLFPQFSVLDPSKTFTLPTRQVANGLVDAFVHTVEQYLTYPVQALAQDRFAEGLLQTLVEIAPQALADLYQALEQQLIAVLQPHVSEQSLLPAANIARILRLASGGIKAATDNLEELQRMVDGLLLMAVTTMTGRPEI